MVRQILLIFTCLGFCLTVSSQPPSDYYSSATGLSRGALKSAVHDIIDDHTVISYDGLWSAFRKTDVREDGKVLDMYSDCTFTFGSNQCGNYRDICDCYNREHSMPKSWFNDAKPMYSDLFHLYPTDGKVNGYRSNHPFGECQNGTVYGKGRLGACSYPGYNGTVFEPSDEYKGDFARTYFYMLTRYMDVCKSWSSPMLNNGDFSTWALNMLIEWHDEDPVSDKEVNRNNLIYEDYQHNRNPFIDYPDLVYKIFGVDETPFDPNVSGLFFEDFEMGVKDVYPDGNVQLRSGEWRFNGAAVGTTANDNKLGLKAAKLRLNSGSNGSTGENGYIEMVSAKRGGVSTISLYHATYGVTTADDNSKWRLFISQNGGEFKIFGDEMTSSSELTQVVFSPMMEGDIRIRISKTDGTASRLNIDDIRMEDYGELKPVLSVNPVDLNFGDIKVNTTSMVKAIDVLGVNLKSDIGYEVIGADASYFDVSKALGWSGMSGGDIEVEFSPTEARDYFMQLIFSSSGAENVTVNVRGRGYVQPVPMLSTNLLTNIIDLSTYPDVPVYELFKVSGVNLTDDIRLSILGNNSLSVTPSVISKDDATGANVTVSYAPEEVGVHTAMLKIESVGASPITIAIDGEAYPKPENMVLNGSFENWNPDNTIPAYWETTPESGGRVERNTLKSDGQYSALLSSGDVSNTNSLSLINGIDVQGGRLYKISFDYYIMSQTTGNGGRIWGTWKDADGKEINETNLKPTGYLDKSEKDKWKEFEIVVVAPSNAVKLELGFRWYAKSTLCVDNFVMVSDGDGTIPIVEITSEEFTVVVDNNKNLLISILGRDLTPNSELTLSITGNYFTLEDSVILVDKDGNVDDMIIVNYYSKTIGVHNAEITVNGVGLLSPVKAILTVNSVKPNPPIAVEATEITPNSFRANWQNASTSRYLLTVYDETNTLFADREVDECSYDVMDLEPNKKYYYHVKATTGNYSSNRSNIISLITKTTSVDDVDENGILAYYVNGKLFVEFQQSMNCDVQFFDIRGRLLFIDEVFGETVFMCEVKLDSGIYMLRVVSGSKIFTKKLIIK